MMCVFRVLSLNLMAALVGLSMSLVPGSSDVLAAAWPNRPDESPDTPDVTTLRNALKSSGSTDEQMEAASQLGAMGPYAFEAVPDLVSMLKSEDPGVRGECIYALGEIGPVAHEATDSLLEFLKSDSPMDLTAALESLRRIGSIPADPDAREWITVLCSHPDAAVHTAAIRYRLVVTDYDANVVRSSKPALLRALAESRDAVRNEAALTLIEIGDSSVPQVTEQLQSVQPMVRLKACDILGRIGPSAASAVPKLLPRLQDEDELVVRAAATALGNIHAEPGTVLPALLKLLPGGSVARQITVVRALGDFGMAASDSTDSVLRLLSSDNAMLRTAAADTLGQIFNGRTDVVEALVKSLSDPNGTVTVHAANALSQIGPAAVPALTAKLSDAAWRGLVVEILGEIGSGAESAVPALAELLNTEDQPLRREAFIALASIGPKANAAVPTLLKILDSPAVDDRQAGAAYVLAHVGAQQAVPRLKQLLASSQNEQVLMATAWALVTLQPGNTEIAGQALPLLLKALSSENALARREALTAISSLGAAAQSALPALLERAASDEIPAVRAEALHGLAEIKASSPQVLPVALASLQDPDPNVRNAARYLAGRLGPAARDAVPLLKESARQGTDFDRVLSAWALVQIDPTEEHSRMAIPLMLSALHHMNPRVRVEATQTLETIGSHSPEIIGALESIQADEDASVRAAVKQALAKLGKAR